MGSVMGSGAAEKVIERPMDYSLSMHCFPGVCKWNQEKETSVLHLIFTVMENTKTSENHEKWSMYVFV